MFLGRFKVDPKPVYHRISTTGANRDSTADWEILASSPGSVSFTVGIGGKKVISTLTSLYWARFHR